MEVYSTNQQSSTWGAAFNKPLILLTPQEGAALLERKMQQKSMGNMTLQENNSTLATNNSYRNQNTIYEAVSYTHLDVYKRQEQDDGDGGY